MNNVINHSDRSRKNTPWQAQAHPAHYNHQYEVLAHLVGAALKRVFNCRSLEAA
jgi:hypothetical protein